MTDASARDRLLDSAEALMAERGVHGVSLRAINAEAGLSPAALHYHFKSREQLVEAILGRRMAMQMERRAARLDALEAGPGAPDARDVMEALVMPLAELLMEKGDAGDRYVRFLARAFADGAVDHRFLLARYAEGSERLDSLLQRALPDLPSGLVRLRLGFAVESMLRILATRDTGAGARSEASLPLDASAFVTGLIDFLAGGCNADSRLAEATSHMHRSSRETRDDGAFGA